MFYFFCLALQQGKCNIENRTRKNIDERKLTHRHAKAAQKITFRSILLSFSLILLSGTAIFYADFNVKSDEEYLAELCIRPSNPIFPTNKNCLQRKLQFK
jgi:uncharacterized pyridoxamine 5'-phosphate oxidase family protein